MTIIVAEIGQNYIVSESPKKNLSSAIKLIDMAKECGADYVKFQCRTPDMCIPKPEWNTPRIPPWGGDIIPYIEYRKTVELTDDQYREIDRHCRETNIKWFASVWDDPSLRQLLKFDPPFVKIPSAKITDDVLVRECALSGKPVVMSTGMTTQEELDKAIGIFYIYSNKHRPLYLLHCTSSYPIQDSEVNLKLMRQMMEDYPGTRIGFSSHHTSPYPAIYAAVLGAEMVEAHVTLDRTLPGTDHAASLEKPGLSLLVREVRRIPVLMGSSQRRVLESEAAVRKKLRGY